MRDEYRAGQGSVTLAWPLSWNPDFLHPGESGFHGHYDRYMHAPESGQEGNLVNGQIDQELQPSNQKMEPAGNGCKLTEHLKGRRQECLRYSQNAPHFASKRQQAPTLIGDFQGPFFDPIFLPSFENLMFISISEKNSSFPAELYRIYFWQDFQRVAGMVKIDNFLLRETKFLSQKCNLNWNEDSKDKSYATGPMLPTPTVSAFGYASAIPSLQCA